MAKLIYMLHTSLDCYVEDKHGSFDWSVPDEEVNSYINEVVSSFGTHLYGRRMYEAMVYWETAYAAQDQPQFQLEFARQWQRAEKVVYSKTLAEPRSARTRLERTFDPERVRQIKAAAEHNLMINGPELAAQALRAGLVDEVQMIVCPVVVGGGKRFFPDDTRLDLSLLGERRFGNGVVVLEYAVANKPLAKVQQ